MAVFKKIIFSEIGDSRGSLISLEQFKNVPFEIKRTYYLYGLSKEHPRGFHAHKKLTQLAVCLNGSCSIVMNDGTNEEIVLMDDPAKGLLIEPYQWHVMKDFSENCILIVLADDYYDESDYIRDFEKFIQELK